MNIGITEMCVICYILKIFYKIFPCYYSTIVVFNFCYNCGYISGEQFEQLRDTDDQGWCTGRKSGRVGLYPDKYVKLLSK